jgi:lambda family phage portal protein
MSDRLPIRLWRAMAQAWRGEDAPRRRSYAAAQPHRLLNDWSGTAQSADKSTRYQAKQLRFRARELRENSPIVARYAHLVRDNVIGPDGITLQAAVPSTRGVNKPYTDRVEAAWYAWAERCTADGRTLTAVCAQLAESWKIEGEALLEVIPSAQAPCGLWLKALDADVLDDKLNMDRTPGGGSIVQGVEFDARGRRISYHVLTRHPSDGVVAQYRVLPADRLLVLSHRTRPEQTRGITALAPVMIHMQHLDKTDEAIVVLNRITASKMGTLTPDDTADTLEGSDGQPPQIEQAPGEWWVLPRGYKADMLDPGQPTQEYDVFARHMLRKIAAGLHVAYASLTGDLSDVNFSSTRAGILVERDAWRMAQSEFVSGIMRPVFRWWLDTADLSGALAIPAGQSADSIAASSTWHPRRWSWVDPLKDANTIEKMLELGLTTKTREANALGLAFTDLMDERAEEDAYAKTLGVVLGPPNTAAPEEVTDPESDPPAVKPARQLRAV